MTSVLAFTLLLLAVFGYVVTAPVADPSYHDYHHEPIEHHVIPKKQIPILKQDFEQHHEGYQYSYETGNGIHAHETGYIKNKGDKKHETLVQQGKITYHDEHGHPITLTYIADEHGFQPQGDHLPTPPPLPIELAKAMEEHAQAHHTASLQHQSQHEPVVHEEYQPHQYDHHY